MGPVGSGLNPADMEVPKVKPDVDDPKPRPGVDTSRKKSDNKSYVPEKIKLDSGEMAYRSADLSPNGEAVLVRSPEFLDESGHIKWPEANGFVTDSAGNAITEPANLKNGDVVDRYGPSGGTFTSPVKNGQRLAYDTRGLPYPEETLAYHQYEVVKDINIKNVQDGYSSLSEADKLSLDNLMKKYDFTLDDIANPQKGTIAEVFGAGGGTQIKFGTSISWYEKLGLLREVF